MTEKKIEPPKLRYGEIGNEYGEPINTKVYKADEADAYIRYLQRALCLAMAEKAKCKYDVLHGIIGDTEESKKMVQ